MHCTIALSRTRAHEGVVVGVVTMERRKMKEKRGERGEGDSAGTLLLLSHCCCCSIVGMKKRKGGWGKEGEHTRQAEH